MRKVVQSIITFFLLLGFTNILSAEEWNSETLMSSIVGVGNLQGDFDNDGDVDLLIQSGDTLYLYENQIVSSGSSQAEGGATSFQSSFGFSFQRHTIDDKFKYSEMSALNIVDMDGDGDLDVLQAAMHDRGGIFWSENLGDGKSWARHLIKETAKQMGNMPNAFGDIDGDGDMDFAMIYWELGTTVWFEQVSEDEWKEHRISPFSKDGIWATVGDIDNDGDLDVLSGRFYSGQIILYENNLPDGEWKSVPIKTIIGSALAELHDIDEDGDLDLVTHSNKPGSEKLVWLENPSWDEHKITSGVPFLNYGATGDMDNDGDLDVAFGGSDDIGWCENLGGAQKWQRHMIDRRGGLYPIPTGIVDIDLDSLPDLTAYIIDYSQTPTIGDALWYTRSSYATFVKQNLDPKSPQEFSLAQNYPNPFNPTTTIEFTLPNAKYATLKVFDINGKEISTLVHETLSAGIHAVTFDASDLPSGIYLYRLTSGEIVESRKMMVVR